jgi:hypothetical protein
MKALRERRRLSSSALLVSLLAVPACSDEWAPHPHVVLPASLCPDRANATRLPRNCFDLIAEFDGDRVFAYSNGRSGGWFSYDDRSLDYPNDGGPSPRSVQFRPPPPDGGTASSPGEPVTPHETFPSRAPSVEALHARAGAYSGSFGSGVGTNFNSVLNIATLKCCQPLVAEQNTDMTMGLGIPEDLRAREFACDPVHSCQPSYHAEGYDASQYDGIILWARRGSTPGVSSTVRIQITTVATDSNYATNYGAGLAETGAKGPDIRACNPNATSAATGRCDDDYGKILTLLADWGEPYKIPWSDLIQEGFGRIPPEGFAPSEVVTIKFTNKQGQAFDEWFDDIALYKE